MMGKFAFSSLKDFFLINGKNLYLSGFADVFLAGKMDPVIAIGKFQSVFWG